MQRRNFIQVGFAALAALFTKRSSKAKPKAFVDPRRGSGIGTMPQSPYLPWKSAESKTTWKVGDSMVVALKSYHPKEWQIDSVSVIFLPDADGYCTLASSSGELCQTDWSEVEWYVNLDDLISTLPALQ
ncbi:hypothetical protein [Gimesia aquarii]|uniref:Uncharacterized protein n=1 Tax=Gimesia aquarii TaxID=2527964 RepID=A0A517X1B2_9PLAN|nr:hypothetical protein [Gimesia aquarii]QDU11296.1 hypothetical protein V202x_47150 [Gimesia aquarii]